MLYCVSYVAGEILSMLPMLVLKLARYSVTSPRSHRLHKMDSALTHILFSKTFYFFLDKKVMTGTLSLVRVMRPMAIKVGHAESLMVTLQATRILFFGKTV